MPARYSTSLFPKYGDTRNSNNNRKYALRIECKELRILNPKILYSGYFLNLIIVN